MGKYRFSIIIPTFNSEKFVKRALKSVLEQNYDSVEILIVDDNSEDDTLKVLEGFSSYKNIQIYKLTSNGGPGIARNVGISKATGDYIIFLDSDDMLAPFILQKLDMKLADYKDPDILGFDYALMGKNHDIGCRWDIDYLNLPKEKLLYHYLQMHMIGAVIFNVFRRGFIKEYNINFFEGLHEDIDFMFKSFLYARTIKRVKLIGYIKDDRENSIVNTITTEHIKGYFRAWHEVEKYVPVNLKKSFYAGAQNICVFKIKDVLKLKDKRRSMSLYAEIYRQYKKIDGGDYKEKGIRKTSYESAIDSFTNLMEKEITLKELEETLKGDLAKTWGCWELFNSLFLAPDEIRTCCKRFFIDGVRKGDIVLFKTNMVQENLLSEIVQSKRKLYNALNQGEETECDSCPYLEFKNWNDSNNFLDIRKISFEYQTCCNLRCIYCSELFYGGNTPNYSITGLLDDLITNKCLDKCESIVWGGGEPTVDVDFPKMISNITEINNCGVQRVVTNAVIYAPVLAELLLESKVNIITSVDAGTPEVYKKIRGQNFFGQVISNLKKYAEKGAENIIVKYILLDENSSTNEINSFVNAIKHSPIMKCDFQISCDFKREKATKNIIKGAIFLYYQLKKAGARCVYLDELARERIVFSRNIIEECQTFLKDLDDFIFYNGQNTDVYLCGNVIQIKRILDNSMFAKEISSLQLIAGHPAYEGHICNGIKLYPLEKMLESDNMIIVAASQGTSHLIKRIKDIGIDPNRICDKLII